MTRYEAERMVGASADRVFAHVDDPARLSSHMTESSWRMGGGRMRVDLDERRGQAVGSRIRLKGRVLGFELAVEEIVTERDPPLRKVWETAGTPKLLVIGHYRMGFELSPRGPDSVLRVFIEYSRPTRAPASWLGLVFGDYYARWCVQRMIEDAARQFAPVHHEGAARI